MLFNTINFLKLTFWNLVKFPKSSHQRRLDPQQLAIFEMKIRVTGDNKSLHILS